MLQESIVGKIDINIEDQLFALKSKHTQLETALKREQERPQPDNIRIQEIKREKLALKDQLLELTTN
ncbi:MAG: hypothetical protein CMM28_09920 [Rhodospirillaceae bacterium]|nr:hypothetical protein [Rhodospirillaceae bacterium]|tara:strand:+ start:2489 stop:2689 length:201 start_codon:yes stop_codon:yes gene_type:complete